MSIEKAALIFFYEDEEFTEWNEEDRFLDYGYAPEAFHTIVGIAGAHHASWLTTFQVLACLSNSPYWNRKFYPGFYSEMWGHEGATIYRPSEKGKIYYRKYLKKD